MTSSLLSLLPPPCMVVPNRELVNTLFPFDTSIFSTPMVQNNMNMDMDVDTLRDSVMILILRVGYKNNSCIRETQENSIEIPLQSSLPYILLPMVCAHYCAPYPN